MDSKTIRPEQFQKAVMDALAKYGDDVSEMLEAETKSIARKTVSTLKGSAPSGGSYARGWSHKAQKGGAYKLSDTVYNRTDYQLTHLLEKPHSTGRYGGGSYPKKKDYTGTIERIEEQQTTRFMEEVMSKL